MNSQVSVVLSRNMLSLALYEIYQEYLASIPLGNAFYRRPLAIQWIFFANHSGKRTCATFSYQADIQEQSIISRTGHQSLENVRKYRRPFSEMLKDVSSVLENSVPISKKINLEAADVSMNVPAEKPVDQKSDCAVSYSTFNNYTFTCNLMK